MPLKVTAAYEATTCTSRSYQMYLENQGSIKHVCLIPSFFVRRITLNNT